MREFKECPICGGGQVLDYKKTGFPEEVFKRLHPLGFCCKNGCDRFVEDAIRQFKFCN